MREITVVLSAVVALLWVPIGWRFFRGWKERSNPISLAICSLVAYNIYMLVLFSWDLIAKEIPIAKLRLTLSLFSMIICAYFYVSFKWSDAKYLGDRAKDTNLNGSDSNTESTS